MVRRTRSEMEETRATLLETARRAFCERGYADTSMDDLTAQAGLTRGALYHHFGDKRGLLAAVVAQLDTEMDARLNMISDASEDLWQAFCQRCRAYLEMALEPEIQRIVLRDARAVLGGASPDSQQHCIQSMQCMIAGLIQQRVVNEADPQAMALLIYGGLAEAAFWIASAEDGNVRLGQSVTALDLLLCGLLAKK